MKYTYIITWTASDKTNRKEYKTYQEAVKARTWLQNNNAEMIDIAVRLLT
jgi:hypothetical protein